MERANDKEVREIISRLHDIYGYGIFEVQGDYGLASSWIAAVKIGERLEVVTFASYEYAMNLNMFDLMNELYHNFQTSSIHVNVILFIESKVYEGYGFNYDTIIVNFDSKDVLYYSQNSMILAEHIGYSLQSMVKKKSERAVVTTVIIVVNILYFILSAVISGSILDIDGLTLVVLGAKYNPGIMAGQYYRLVTCMFLHGGILHLALNMYALYSIGPLVERTFGKVKFIIIYFISGITSSLLSYLLSSGISIGASGAIFGLLGACLVLAVKMKNRIGKGFLYNIASVIFINLVMGLSIPNIDNFGHMGGLLGGIVTTSIAIKDLK